MRGIFLCFLTLTVLAACSGYGPRDPAILNTKNATVLKSGPEEPYAVIEVSKAVARKVSSDLVTYKKTDFFNQSGPSPVVIGPGDTLSISIVSSNNTGFLDFAGGSLSPISTTTLPPQEVSSDGTVNVPPLGRLLARGKSVQSFENFVRRKLSEVLVDPSVIIQLTNRKSARVTVLGAVQAPGAVSLSTTENRLIDMITAAGGPTDRPEDLSFTLIRKGRSATIPLDHLYNAPAYNISALPGDVISVMKPQKEVTVLGAFGSNTKVRIDGPSVSLAESIGQFGGLIRNRARLTGVYVYRETPKATLAALGADVSMYAGEAVPTVYKFDFTKPTVFFTADEFQIADGDILYTTQSTLSEINDVITSISPIIAAPRTYGQSLDPTNY
jgi:polysaccharide export outer membrane protein